MSIKAKLEVKTVSALSDGCVVFCPEATSWPAPSVLLSRTMFVVPHNTFHLLMEDERGLMGVAAGCLATPRGWGNRGLGTLPPHLLLPKLVGGVFMGMHRCLHDIAKW